MFLDSQIRAQLATVRDYIRYGASLFQRQQLYFGHGTDNAWDESVALVLYGLDLPPQSDKEVLDARLCEDEKLRIAELFERRCQRIPLPYITGEAWFAGLQFDVDERVLIPRSPIGELIQNQFVPWIIEPPGTILDLCTGSGCIGIASALTFGDARVLLSDISLDALRVAEKNVVKHQVSGRVTVLESDLFERISERFDIIIANPPYVDAEDLASMPEEFYVEPALALASGADGLDFIRRLLREAHDFLTEHGCLCVEVGNSRRHLEAAFPEVPFNWIDLEHGGHGVFILYRNQLEACADWFQ